MDAAVQQLLHAVAVDLGGLALKEGGEQKPTPPPQLTDKEKLKIIETSQDAAEKVAAANKDVVGVPDTNPDTIDAIEGMANAELPVTNSTTGVTEDPYNVLEESDADSTTISQESPGQLDDDVRLFTRAKQINTEELNQTIETLNDIDVIPTEEKTKELHEQLIGIPSDEGDDEEDDDESKADGDITPDTIVLDEAKTNKLAAFDITTVMPSALDDSSTAERNKTDLQKYVEAQLSIHGKKLNKRNANVILSSIFMTQRVADDLTSDSYKIYLAISAEPRAPTLEEQNSFKTSLWFQLLLRLQVQYAYTSIERGTTETPHLALVRAIEFDVKYNKIWPRSKSGFDAQRLISSHILENASLLQQFITYAMDVRDTDEVCKSAFVLRHLAQKGRLSLAATKSTKDVGINLAPEMSCLLWGINKKTNPRILLENYYFETYVHNNPIYDALYWNYLSFSGTENEDSIPSWEGVLIGDNKEIYSPPLRNSTQSEFGEHVFKYLQQRINITDDTRTNSARNNIKHILKNLRHYCFQLRAIHCFINNYALDPLGVENPFRIDYMVGRFKDTDKDTLGRIRGYFNANGRKIVCLINVNSHTGVIKMWDWDGAKVTLVQQNAANTKFSTPIQGKCIFVHDANSWESAKTLQHDLGVKGARFLHSTSVTSEGLFLTFVHNNIVRMMGEANKELFSLTKTEFKDIQDI